MIGDGRLKHFNRRTPIRAESIQRLDRQREVSQPIMATRRVNPRFIKLHPHLCGGRGRAHLGIRTVRELDQIWTAHYRSTASFASF